MDDLEGAAAFLKSQAHSNGKVGIIGFCSGGRYTLMMACLSSDIDAAVDSAGGHIVHEPTELRPVQPMDMVPDLSCPLLALFGVEDENPTPEQAQQMKALLDEHGKTYEWVMYNNAGHAFFADYRPQLPRRASPGHVAPGAAVLRPAFAGLGNYTPKHPNGLGCPGFGCDSFGLHATASNL